MSVNLLPRLGVGEHGEGARGYLGAAIKRLRNASVGEGAPSGDGESAAAALVRELQQRQGVLEGLQHKSEQEPWKQKLRASVSPERTEELKQLARSLTPETKFAAVLYHKRLKLCRQFRSLLQRVLAASLRMLGGEASFGGQRRVACLLLASCYFRLPEFRAELLRCVLPPEGRSAAVEEWRGTEYNLDLHALAAAEKWLAGSPLRLLLQWEAFHSVLRDYFGREALQDDDAALQNKLLPEPDWREELSPSGSSFFTFLEQFVRSLLLTAAPRGPLEWKDIPGYRTLLKRLLLEMKSRSVTKYPDSLANCTGAVLVNEKLLSVFVKIVLLKTHAHNSPQVFAALSYLDFWAQLIASRGRQLPPNFDFAFLRKGLQLVIESDLYANVSKGLWFIYRNLPILNGEQLSDILNDLCLLQQGSRLFLHWAWVVRRAFMWLLLYRLVEGMRRVIGRITGQEPSFPSARNHYYYLQHQQQQQQQPQARRVALSTEEAVVISGHSVFVSFLRALSLEELLPPAAVKAVEALAMGDCNYAGPPAAPAAPAGAPAAAAAGAAQHQSQQQLQQQQQQLLQQQQQQQQQQFEADLSAPAVQVYRRQAVLEFKREVEHYKAWVREGASSLPMMIIPSAPLDANTDVPLEGWQ